MGSWIDRETGVGFVARAERAIRQERLNNQSTNQYDPRHPTYRSCSDARSFLSSRGEPPAAMLPRRRRRPPPPPGGSAPGVLLLVLLLIMAQPARGAPALFQRMYAFCGWIEAERVSRKAVAWHGEGKNNVFEERSGLGRAWTHTHDEGPFKPTSSIESGPRSRSRGWLHSQIDLLHARSTHAHTKATDTGLRFGDGDRGLPTPTDTSTLDTLPETLARAHINHSCCVSINPRIGPCIDPRALFRSGINPLQRSVP